MIISYKQKNYRVAPRPVPFSIILCEIHARRSWVSCVLLANYAGINFSTLQVFISLIPCLYFVSDFILFLLNETSYNFKSVALCYRGDAYLSSLICRHNIHTGVRTSITHHVGNINMEVHVGL